MDSRALWKQLCSAVTYSEWQRLVQNDSNLMIGPFNRETLLFMRDKMPHSFEISETAIQGLTAQLREYLNRHMAEHPEGHRWIILSCVYLALVLKQPMHPQRVVHWVRRIEKGRTAYFCPCRDNGEESVCLYCVCR